VYWLASERVLFTGDVMVGTGTVVIAPPDGEMRTYVATLQRLRSEFADAQSILGGHGPAITDPVDRIDYYIRHRAEREQQIIDAIGEREATIPQIVERVYTATPRALWPAAARQVLAYLIALEHERRIISRPLSRKPDKTEAAILDPDLSKLADIASIAVARAELGYDRDLELREYAYVGAPVSGNAQDDFPELIAGEHTLSSRDDLVHREDVVDDGV